MRKSVLQNIGIGIGFLAIVLVSTSGNGYTKERIKQGEKVSTLLPSSLDALYPPKAGQPVYLLKMLGLGTHLSGIVADLFENKPQQAIASFELFNAQYAEISKMVPEWRRYYPQSPVPELGVALKSEDRAKIMGALQKVRNVCHECHTIYMPIVQQKYHWGDFSAISIKDPLSKEEIDFSRLMGYLDANFAGISTSVERGDKEAAQRQLQGFAARFQSMKETCRNCHGTEMKYYVDESVQAIVTQLGHVLSGTSVDPQVVGLLRQRIGMESCIKCHRVHIPAAYAKFTVEKSK